MFLVGACGGIVTAGEAPGFLFSPGWPGSYPPNLDCSWLIRSDSTVELNLLSVDIEEFPMCYLDSLVIRDGELWKKFDARARTHTHIQMWMESQTTVDPLLFCSARVLFWWKRVSWFVFRSEQSVPSAGYCLWARSSRQHPLNRRFHVPSLLLRQHH